MKVIVKYGIIDHSNLAYGMFKEDGEMIPNDKITERKVPLGGISSNTDWLRVDMHRFTDAIREQFPEAEDVEYVLTCSPVSEWISWQTLLKDQIKQLTGEERMELLDGWCKYCGELTETYCHCRNDD